MSTEVTLPRRTMRIRMVAEKTGLATSSIWRLARQGQFPIPVRLSPGCTAWFEHEIEAWLDAKSVKREADPAYGQKPERGGTRGNTAADADSVTKAETPDEIVETGPVAATATAGEAVKTAKITAAVISATVAKGQRQRNKSNAA